MDPKLLKIVQDGDTQALWQLLRTGALMNLSQEDRAELPRRIAAEGNVEMLRLHASQSHAIAWEPDEKGRDVLHYAALSGDAKTVAFAVNVLGFDPLRGDRRGYTALDLAKSTEAGEWLKKHLGFSTCDCYRNPVRRGFYPDPSVVRVGEDYYMVNSTFVQFPCLPISHSRDLIHWETIGHAITNLDWSGLKGLPGGHGYWAADISYHQGRYWIIATLRRDTEPLRLQMITSAAKPEGPYDKPKFLDIDGIDPSLFTDVDGKRYVVINPGAQIAQISQTGELLSKPEMIYYGSARVKTEGPHLLWRDGWYYLFEAEGGTGPGHTETVARSRSLRGPYEPCPYNPILGAVEKEAPIRRSGHGKPFMTADDRWMMLYLCGRDVDGMTMLGRETALDPMTWTPDGWPIVNGRRGPSCLQKRPLPSVYPQQKESYPWMEFIAPRTDPASFACVMEDGWRLKAGKMPDSTDETSLLLRRQSERSFVQEVTVDVSALNGIAGLCGYYDENSFYVFGLENTPEGLRLMIYEQVGTKRQAMVLAHWTDRKATLRVEANGAKRTLLYLRHGEYQPVKALDAAYLSDEGIRMGKRFTGATLGAAAIGTGEALFKRYLETMIP